MVAGEIRTPPLGGPSIPAAPSTQPLRSPFTTSIILTLGLMYLVAGLIIGVQVGPWEAIRKVLLNGVVVAGWLASAHWILRNQPVPEEVSIRYPRAELGFGLVVLLVMAALAANGYGGWVELPPWLFMLVWYGSLATLFLGLRYPPRALGLRWPSRRGWLALLAAVGINVAMGLIAQVIPPGETAPVASGDMADQMTGVWSVVTLVVTLLVIAAIPEEWLLRVTLQPRLARFMPLGWAIVMQAFLFAAVHLPQKVIGYEMPGQLALGYTLVLDNGLIAGYLWRRERSLLLLVLLHLFAFPRFGL